MEYIQEREEVAYFMKRLYTQKLTTRSGGNISFKINENTVLITPSAIDKARLEAKHIGIILLDGANLTPDLKLSMETNLHLAIYRKRSDISAIIHAHPTIATSFTVLNRRINTGLTAEARAVLGVPIFAPYALMGTQDLAEIVSDASLDGNVVLMENHGVLTVGRSLLEAFDRIEVLEAAAKMSLITEILKDKHELSKEHLQQIDEMFS